MIEIKAYIEEDQLKLLVYNTGAGIEESEIPHIFNRFRISNSAEKDTNIQAASRTGLGLSICKGLVNTLKGTIDVKSEVGKYVKFTVSLPRIKEKFSQCMDKTVKSPIETNKNEAFDELSKPKILVVDDNNDITWLIAHTLTPEFHIRQASSAKEALEMIKETTPDLIITDIVMPEMSGLEFTKQIKSESYSRSIPVVIVSAKVTQAEQAEGFKTGADAYLTKPFTPQLLKSVVHRFLINKREMKNYYQSSESIYEYSEGKLIHEEDKELMKKVVAVIKENIENESLRPAFIANQLGMNVRSFYQYFKNISSLSPSDFIKNFRLNYAATMLLTTKLTVQEIIYKTGMTNKSYFYREFAKKYNKTPREYRDQEQNVKKK
jgi:YesN/AraC family two-component response regulator